MELKKETYAWRMCLFLGGFPKLRAYWGAYYQGILLFGQVYWVPDCRNPPKKELLQQGTMADTPRSAWALRSCLLSESQAHTPFSGL